MSERDELVTRLRSPLGAGVSPSLWFNRAADQIERDGREIERMRGQIAAIVAAYDRTFFMHTADFHSDGCGCLRCEIDRARAALRSMESSHD